MALAERFNAEVPDTINFEFNSAELTDEATAILQQQANFIRQFPEVRFRVFGHTDLVGSDGYNQRLGLRRAQAAVAYLSSLGVSRSRLEAVVSYGKTRPLIVQTNQPEVRNRRTVTEVSGFVESHPLVLNGKYAADHLARVCRQRDRGASARGANVADAVGRRRLIQPASNCEGRATCPASSFPES